MTLYKCEPCNYETRDKSNFLKHTSSKKHGEKVNEYKIETLQKPHRNSTKNLEKEYICPFCDLNYSTSSSLARHKRICTERQFSVDEYNNQIVELKKEIEINNQRHLKDIENIYINHKKEMNHLKALHKQELKASDHQIESLQRENQRLLALVNNAGSIMKSSISTTNYIIKNFKDAPPLAAPEDFSKLTYANNDSDNESISDESTDSETEPIKDMRNAFVEGVNKDIVDDESFFDISIKDKEKFVEKIAKYYRKRKISKYLGDIIIKHYKKKDPKDQSIFNSDTTRLTYIIRELFDNQTIDWTVDKKGIKTTNCIINPFLEHIKELIREYMQIKTGQM